MMPNTLGTFHKSIIVNTSASATPIRLTLQGRVLREVVDYDKDFPVRIGDVRLSTDNIEFDDVNRGEQPQTTLYLFNAGKKDYTPELMHLPKYLSAYAEPEVIRPGRMGKLIVTLNSTKCVALDLRKPTSISRASLATAWEQTTNSARQSLSFHTSQTRN